MPILNLILGRQIILGMLAAACLFVPWNQRRPHFPLRLGLGMLLLFVLIDYVFVPNVFMWSLLLYVALLILLIWACFDCGVLHAVFSATCAYAVQHITSKLAYMTVMPLILKDGERSRPVFLLLLVLANALVGIPVFLRFTRPFLKKGQLMFDNVKTVICSGPFLAMAVFLSSVLERSFDRAADGFLMNYFALNTSCILFAAMILALEFSNCNIKYLEHENMVLGQLLESDKLQYEQAKRDMEKINIRYHDLKQQYSRATDEERVRLEEEMKTLNLRYYTGNKAVDITLSQKAGACEGAGVQLVCSVDGGCLSRMKHYHIYSLLGNAIDNAIECLMKVDDASRKVISLDISRCRDMAVIRMENYTPAMPVLQDGVLVTTKRDTNGTAEDKFSPEQNCTQAQILTFLYRAAREEQVESSSEDMELAVQWAREKGMIDDSFDGNTPCTRATAVSYIWQAFDKPNAQASSFTDVPTDAPYGYAVDWAVEKGVTNGTSDTAFSPEKVCSRGEIVTFLYRAYN